MQDHVLLAAAIARVLEEKADVTVCGIAHTDRDAALIAAQERADVVLIDFRLPDVSGTAAAGMVRTNWTCCRRYGRAVTDNGAVI